MPELKVKHFLQCAPIAVRPTISGNWENTKNQIRSVGIDNQQILNGWFLIVELVPAFSSKNNYGYKKTNILLLGWGNYHLGLRAYYQGT